jgi:hypothetical protein
MDRMTVIKVRLSLITSFSLLFFGTTAGATSPLYTWLLLIDNACQMALQNVAPGMGKLARANANASTTGKIDDPNRWTQHGYVARINGEPLAHQSQRVFSLYMANRLDGYPWHFQREVRRFLKRGRFFVSYGVPLHLDYSRRPPKFALFFAADLNETAIYFSYLVRVVEIFIALNDKGYRPNDGKFWTRVEMAERKYWEMVPTALRSRDIAILRRLRASPERDRLIQKVLAVEKALFITGEV